MRPARPAILLLAVTCVSALTACGSDNPGSDTGSGTATGATDAPGTETSTEPEGDEGPLVVYAGRSEELVGPLLEDLEAAVGVPVEVRYGSSAELAAQLLEEGDATDADIYFSQDAGALGALAKAGMLAELDDAVIGDIDERYRDSGGRWVATSARARVLAYNPEQVPDIEEIDEIDDILEEEFRGRIGYAPTNASFHAFVTALRVIDGEEDAREWLTEFAALEPEAYESNGDVLDAVDRGDVSLGLINHYYWYQKVAELGEDAVTARIHFLDNDDPGALVNVAGVGVLDTTDQETAARAAVQFLLSDEAQTYFADETAEYPVVEGISTDIHDLEPLGELDGAQIDLNELDTLEETLALLDEVGLT